MDKACKPLRLKCVMSSDVGWVANGNPTAPIYLVPTLQRRGFYKLLPYKKGLIDSTASCLEFSPFLVEYATLFHSTTKFSTLSYPKLRLFIKMTHYTCHQQRPQAFPTLISYNRFIELLPARHAYPRNLTQSIKAHSFFR